MQFVFNLGTEIADRDNASRHVADANPDMTAYLHWDGALFSTDDGDFYAVTLSTRSAGVSLPGICRHTSTGRASAAGLGCTGVSQWHTRPQLGRIQSLL